MSFTQELCKGPITFKKTAQIINSFVFLDIETTDLIKGKIMPRITELALVAITRDHLMVPQPKLPRVLAKLVIPINPDAKIKNIVTKITHLSNHNLQKLKTFDENIFGSVLYFLQRLEEPICFVAHNGKRFDFPILLNEFRNHEQEMPSEFLCIDSIDVFRNYFQKKPLANKVNIEVNDSDSCHSLLVDSWDDVVGAALDSVEKSESFDENTQLERANSFDKSQELYMNIQRTSQLTSELQIMNQKTDRKPENWKLGTIFKYMTDSSVASVDNEHYAENDCLTLIRCANLIGNNFIEFADNYATPLISCERR